MRRTHSFKVVHNFGGRPPAAYKQNHQRTTAIPTPVLWIPIGLTVLLSLTSLWSWSTLQPSLADLGLLSSWRSNTLSHSEVEAVNSLTVSTDLPLPDTISPVFTPQVQHWSSEIAHWAAEYNLDPNLIAVLMQIESCGHPSVRSSAGALGLFQVMPFHFKTDEDPLDPKINAQRGLSYFARSLQLSNGKIGLALAGYNGGHGLINRSPDTWPLETRQYVSWGTAILEDIYRGEHTSSHLDSWLAAGGASLCKHSSVVLDNSNR